MQTTFGFVDMPSVSVLNEKMALSLVNTHFALEKVEPLPPNLISVSGLQIKDPEPIDEVSHSLVTIQLRLLSFSFRFAGSSQVH